MFVMVYFFFVMFIIIYYCCGLGVEDDLVGFGLCWFKLEIYIVGLFFDDEGDEEGEGIVYFKCEDDYNELLFWYKVLWLFFIIVSVNLFVVILVYWLFDYFGGVIDCVSVNEYIVVGVLMLFEVIISNIFICFMYFIYFYVFGLIYVLFIVIFWVVGGKNKVGNCYIYK